MDKWDYIIILFFTAIFCLITYMATADYFTRKLSAKTNEYERAVRMAAYNKTHLCLNDGTFYEVKIYRMDGNREFYVVRPIK